MSSECIEVSRDLATQDRERRIEEMVRLEETIEEIKNALTAEDFNRGDFEEVTRSKKFFEGRQRQLERSLAERSINSMQQAF